MMFTRKTIYGFIFVVCSLCCHKGYAFLNKDIRTSEYTRVYGLIASGVLLNAAGVYILAVRSLLCAPIGVLLFTLGTAEILFHEKILKSFDENALETMIKKSKKFAVKIEKTKNVFFADEGDKDDTDE